MLQSGEDLAPPLLVPVRIGRSVLKLVGISENSKERVAQVMHRLPEEPHCPLHLLFLPLSFGLAPLEPGLACAQEIQDVGGLDEITIRPQVHALAHLGGLRLGGKKDNWDTSQP